MVRSNLWLLVVVLAVALQTQPEMREEDVLWSRVFDAGHVPLYALLAWALLGAGSSRDRRSRRHLAQRYCFVFVITVAFGALIELVQAHFGRGRELQDVARNAVGAATALLLSYAFAWPGRSDGQRAARLGALTAIAASAGLLAWAFAPVTRTVMACVQRYENWPIICSFDQRLEQEFLTSRRVEYSVVDPPRGWDRPSGARVGRLTYLEGEYPAFIICAPFPSWADHSTFCFDLYSELDEETKVTVRIDDWQHNQAYEDRFNRSFRIRPGEQTIEIPLADVRSAPKSRELDLTRVRAIAVFMGNIERPRTLYVDDFRLEN